MTIVLLRPDSREEVNLEGQKMSGIFEVWVLLTILVILLGLFGLSWLAVRIVNRGDQWPLYSEEID